MKVANKKKNSCDENTAAQTSKPNRIMVSFSKYFLATTLLAFAAIAHAKDKPLGDKGEKLERILNGRCSSDANERCDAYPFKECKDTFLDMCSECFEAVAEGERPSKRCMVNCALLNREELVAQNCTVANEKQLRETNLRTQDKPSPRSQKCTAAMLEFCPTECAGLDDKTIAHAQMQTCWKCAESNRENIAESSKESDCGRKSPPGTCSEKLRKVCGACFSDRAEGKEEESENSQGKCIKACIMENKDELIGAGCKVPKPDDDKLPQPPSAECRAKAEELCTSCADTEDDGFPTKACYVKCFKENKDALKEAGCGRRLSHVPFSVRGFLGRFQRVFKCFRDDLPGLSPNCTKLVQHIDGEPELTTNDVELLFKPALDETTRALGAGGGDVIYYVAAGIGATIVIGGIALLVSKRGTTMSNEGGNTSEVAVAQIVDE